MGRHITGGHYENLETRRMLAAAVSTWSISGNDAGNAITISFRQSDARLLASMDGAVVSTRKLRGLELIEINGGAGNDVITVGLAKPQAALQIWINGGTGRDVIHGGAGDEMILGGSDRDVIDGGAGNDTLRGGTDRDEIYGGDGDDYLQGNAGYDTISGGWGDDKLTGGTGNDQLRGGYDRDRLYGGKDFDTIKGGASGDTLDGGGAANALFSATGDVTIVGEFDTTAQDDGDGALTRIQDDAALREWLIAAAVEQWKWSFGNPVGGGVWTYLSGSVLVDTSVRALNDQVVTTSATYSETNTQETGVDEADLVETDGESIFLLNGSDLIIADARPASDLHQLSRTNVGGSPTGMYLTGSRLTVVTQTAYPIIDWGFIDVAVNSSFVQPIAPTKPQATVIVYDVSNPAAPSVVSKTVLDGVAQDSRVIDGRLYLVMQTNMSAPAPKTVKNDKGEDIYESEAEYRASLDVEAMIPKFTSGERSGALVGAPDVYVREKTRLDVSSVVLMNLNDETPAPIDSTSVVGAAGQVYSSASAMYLAGFGWGDGVKSDLFKFGLGATQVTLEASGTFEGRVLNQFSMDEEGQYFRIATTNNWGAGSASSVSVLDQVGDDLNVIGSIGGLGVSEQIQSARFIGTKAYVTTFRQIDPLYTIDLANPAKPTVAGELKIPGFSNYLHPAGEGLLIGLGRSAGEDGRTTGLELSLFDVSDAAHPARIGTYDFPDDGGFSGSAATFDPHAFAYFEDISTLSIPVSRYVDGKSEQSTQVLKVDPAKGFTLLGEISHDGEVRRSVRIDNALYSIGGDAVNVVDLTDIDHVIAHLELPPLSTDPVGIEPQ